MDKHPIPRIPRILLFILLLASFIILEYCASSYRQEGILTRRTTNKEATVEYRKAPIKERGHILILLTTFYLSFSTAMLYLIFHDKQFLKLGLALHIALLVLCLSSYALAIVLNYGKIYTISRFFFSLALSPTVLIIFIASFPLYKLGKKSLA